MRGSFCSRLPFLIAAALIAAALADPVVESVSNTGILGGRYADNDHLGVMPTLLVGLLLVLEILALRFLEVLRQSRQAQRSGDALVDIAGRFATRSAAQDLPYVFAMQLAALFVLESGEQLAAGGKLLGGTAWLGGPVIFSLIVHGLVGTGCTFALGALMRVVVRTFASIVLTAIHFIWLAIEPANDSAFNLPRRDTACPRAQNPHVRQIGGRAPPLLLTLA
jgi:hypothetical protein